MSLNDQIRELIDSHYSLDEARFRAAVLRMAAYAAQKDNREFGKQIIALSDSYRFYDLAQARKVVEAGYFKAHPSKGKLTDIVLDEKLSSKVFKIVNEHLNRNKLKALNIPLKRKILIEGRRGDGRRTLANAFATSVELPFMTLSAEMLIADNIGRSCARLEKVFGKMSAMSAVYFFDGIDALCEEGKDLGILRDLLFGYISQESSDSYIVLSKSQDTALPESAYLGFEAIWRIEAADAKQVKAIVDKRAGAFDKSYTLGLNAAKKLVGLTRHDIVRLCDMVACECAISSTGFSDKAFLQAFEEELPRRTSEVKEEKGTALGQQIAMTDHPLPPYTPPLHPAANAAVAQFS